MNVKAMLAFALLNCFRCGRR